MSQFSQPAIAWPAPMKGPLGRKKRLSAEQASLCFEAMVQIQAAQQLLDRTLEAAGITRGSRSMILTGVWRSRGRVDIPHKLLRDQAFPNVSSRPGAGRRSRRANASS